MKSNVSQPASALLVTESGFELLLDAVLARLPAEATVSELLAASEVGLLMHWSDFGDAMEAVGVRTETVFLKAPALRRAADREAGRPPSFSDAQYLDAAVRKSRPAVVLFASHWGFREYASLVRDALQAVGLEKTRIGFHASYSGILEVETQPDFVLAATPGIRTQVAGYGAPTFLWYLHLPGRKWLSGDLLPHPDRRFPLTFVGNSGFWDSRYQWRAWVLGEILESGEPLSVFHFGRQKQSSLASKLGAGARGRATRVLASLARQSPERVTAAQRIGSSPPAGWFPSVRPHPPGGLSGIIRHHRWESSPVSESSPGTRTEMILRDSRLTVNAHQDPIGDVGNLRMFEAAATGACLVSDAGPNILDLFQPDREVVVYTSAPDAAEKVRYLLEHPLEAAAIAEAGRRRFEASHTPLARAQELLEMGLIHAE